MEAFFSKEIQAGLDQARAESVKKASRIRLSAAGKIHPVLRMWKTGFAMQNGAPDLRGRVDIYDGSLHLFHCLIVTSEEDADERRYEFKHATAVSDRAAVDYECAENAPTALIEDSR